MKPLLWEPQNPINKTVWDSLTKAQPKADLELLEKAVRDYINIAAQSNDGRRSREQDKSYNFDVDIDTTVLTILVESAALVLSGQLEKLKELENGEICPNQDS